MQGQKLHLLNECKLVNLNNFMSLDVFMFGKKNSKEMTKPKCEEELNSHHVCVSLIEG